MNYFTVVFTTNGLTTYCKSKTTSEMCPISHSNATFWLLVSYIKCD